MADKDKTLSEAIDHIRIETLERRIDHLETILGLSNDVDLRAVFKVTREARASVGSDGKSDLQRYKERRGKGEEERELDQDTLISAYMLDIVH